MTVAVLDPVLPLLLPTKTEPLSFDVSTNVTDLIISIVYSNGAWDVAYQDGAFAALYSSSTRSGSHFEIIRTGGWPEGETFKAKVKESVVVITPPPPVVSGPGQSWNVIYSVDLSAQPSQASLLPGPVVIDGITWWLQNGTGPLTGQSSFLQNGVGLVIRATAGTTDAVGIANPTYGHLRYFLPMANLVDYTPGAPLIVLGDFINSAANYAALGLCEGNASAVAVNSDSLTHFMALRSTTVQPTYLSSMSMGITSANHLDIATPTITVTSTSVLSRVDGVMLSNSLVGTIVAFQATATTPDPFNDRQVATLETIRLPKTFDHARLGINFTFQIDASVTSPDFILKKLYVYQPKVP